MAIQHQGAEVGTRGINRGGETRTAATDDYDIVHSKLHAIGFATRSGRYNCSYCSTPSGALP